MHVFADIKPYICTFSDCKLELAQFPNRAAWAEHEFSQHRLTRYWKCAECEQSFTKLSRFSDHWSKEHADIFCNLDLESATEAALYSKENRAETEQCPLCLTVPGHSKRNFIQHVGRHLEQIALMAMPPSEQESPETETTDGSEEEGDSHGARPKDSDSIFQISIMTPHKDFVRSIRMNADDRNLHEVPEDLLRPSSSDNVTQDKADQLKHQSLMKETANSDSPGDKETSTYVTVDVEIPMVDTFPQQEHSQNLGSKVSYFSSQLQVNFSFP